MTKLEFRNIAKLCPWYYHDGQPKCSGNKTVNCAKNRCAMLFWITNWPPNNTVEHRQAECPFCGCDRVENKICPECGSVVNSLPAG